MPSCTGNQKTTGCWVCPHCPKRATPLRCLMVVDDGVAPCALPCRFFTQHFNNPDLLHAHILEKHLELAVFLRYK